LKYLLFSRNFKKSVRDWFKGGMTIGVFGDYPIFVLIQQVNCPPDDKARQMLEEGLEIPNPCWARYYLEWAQRLLGEIALKTNPTQEAVHIEKSIVVLKKIKAENELGLTP